MIFNLISVNNKQSTWENEGLNYYVKQFPKHISINFVNIKGQQHPKRSINEIKEAFTGQKIEKNKEDNEEEPNEDSIVVNIHKNPTNNKNIEELEKELVSLNMKDYEEYINKQK